MANVEGLTIKIDGNKNESEVNMSKLKVWFLRKKNVVLMEVLEQDENLRSKGLIVENGDYSIRSVGNPALGRNTLFVRGESIEMDANVTAREYSTVEAAKEAISAFYKMIHEFNAGTTADDNDDIEITIAE